MSDDPREEADFDRAEALLAEYRQRGAEPAESVDSFAAKHPGLGRQIRELWELCGDVEGVLGQEGSLARDRQRRVSDLLDELQRKDVFAERYSIEAEIGKGGMGAVFRVHDRKLSRPLAMKLILGQAEGRRSGKTPPVEPDELLRFLDEARITSQLDHPSIVPVHEVGVDAHGRAYFTMKLVQGRTLETILAERSAHASTQRLARMSSVIERVCAALAYAHERGVLHRDLKPSNVMVGDFGEVYVMDWGLARHAAQCPDADSEPSRDAQARADAGQSRSSTTTRPGQVIGTPAYMSPEQADGRLDLVSARSDVYAVGALLYHVLAGHAPYCGAGEDSRGSSVLARVQTGPPTRLRTDAGPAELIAICERAMERPREDRYADAGELRQDLQAFLEGGFVKAYPRAKWTRLVRWSRRNPALSASLSCVLALLVVLVLLAARQLATEREAARLDNDVIRLSAPVELEELERSADALWPIQPDSGPAYEAWLDRAEALSIALPAHRAAVEDLERRLAEVGAHDRFGQSREPRSIRWLLGQAQRLVTRVEAFEHPRNGLFTGASTSHGLGVRTRMELGRTLAARSLTDPDAQAIWIAALAGLAADPRFEGVRLEPVFGLLPLGPDPASGLPEFAHLLSGEPARRDASGRLRVEEDTGIVLVLLPGGSFRMGTDGSDLAVARVLGTSVEESPVHFIDLAPYFVSKFETTQGQWTRLFAKNPSRHTPLTYRPHFNRDRRPGSLRHPVELVNWEEAWRFAAWSGLELLTEAQWEHAARAGSSSLWPAGDEEVCVLGFANVSDSFAEGHHGDWKRFSRWLDDGQTLHAPVGSYAPNAFGLHDMLGNVNEWCRDGYGSYARSYNPGDGERILPGTWDRVVRGGSYSGAADLARPAYRDDMEPLTRQASLGFRVGRRIE